MPEGRAFEKFARTLKAKERKKIPEGQFALPGRRYPIHDISHARNALARVSQHGTTEEQSQVRAAVSRRFPEIGKETKVKKANLQTVLGQLLEKRGSYTISQSRSREEIQMRVLMNAFEDELQKLANKNCGYGLRRVMKKTAGLPRAVASGGGGRLGKMMRMRNEAGSKMREYANSKKEFLKNNPLKRREEDFRHHFNTNTPTMHDTPGYGRVFGERVKEMIADPVKHRLR